MAGHFRITWSASDKTQNVWSVHPFGKSILEVLSSGWNVKASKLITSWQTNLSSHQHSNSGHHNSQYIFNMWRLLLKCLLVWEAISRINTRTRRLPASKEGPLFTIFLWRNLASSSEDWRSDCPTHFCKHVFSPGYGPWTDVRASPLEWCPFHFATNLMAITFGYGWFQKQWRSTACISSSSFSKWGYFMLKWILMAFQRV